jgi:hypothetical protein
MTVPTTPEPPEPALHRELAINTHGSSQRRGVHGDPWRRELREPGRSALGLTEPEPIRAHVTPTMGRVTILDGDWSPLLLLFALTLGVLLGWYFL